MEFRSWGVGLRMVKAAKPAPHPKLAKRRAVANSFSPMFSAAAWMTQKGCFGVLPGRTSVAKGSAEV